MKIDGSKYVGIPFKDRGRDRTGIDCWGVVRLVYRDHFGLELPSYIEQYVTAFDHIELGNLIRKERYKKWNAYPLGAERIGDVILIRLKGQPMHVGIVTKQGYMLHVMNGIDVCEESYLTRLWRCRIVGFYRYEK